MTVYAIKRGAELLLDLEVQQDDGTPVDLTDASLSAQIRDMHEALIATPTVTITDAARGQARFAALSDSTWPLGRLKFDFRLVLGGVPGFSETVFISVANPVTQP